jgi:PRC-barrel domain
MCHPVARTAATIGTIVFVSVLLGAPRASASDYTRNLPILLQIAQSTETPTPQTAGPTTPPGVAETVLDEQDVTSVLGVRVRSSAGEDMGRIVNVIVDGTGQVRAAVIDFGGFLGVGNRKIAIDWNALHFATAANKDDRITLDLTRDQVKAAPDYRDGRPLVVIGAAEGLQPPPSPD